MSEWPAFDVEAHKAVKLAERVVEEIVSIQTPAYYNPMSMTPHVYAPIGYVQVRHS